MGTEVDVEIISSCKENAVGTVSGGWWPLGLVVSTIFVLMASSKTAAEYIDHKTNDILIIVALLVMAMLVTAPYIHYSIQGGQFTRLPPRYHHEQKYHDTLNRRTQG